MVQALAFTFKDKRPLFIVTPTHGIIIIRKYVEKFFFGLAVIKKESLTLDTHTRHTVVLVICVLKNA